MAELATIVTQSDALDAEQQQAERLAARIKADFERAQAAKAAGKVTTAAARDGRDPQ